MSTYELTRPETWMLCTALFLPVQPGSVIATWLGSGTFDVRPEIAADALASLRAKGLHDPANAERPFPDDLVETLMLASMNAAEISAVLRSDGTGGVTRFGQVGERLVQFVTDEEHLTLESVAGAADVAEILYPKEMDTKSKGDLRAELPLGAYVYFRQACLQADLALVLSEFRSGDFTEKELVDGFKRDSRWLEIFHALGVRGVPSISEMPLNEYREQLIGRGFLEDAPGGALRIGSAAEPLAAVFSDPDTLTLILSLRVWDGGFPPTGMFLCGGGKLFLVDVKPGLMVVQQLSGSKAGRAWVAGLLAQGSRAKFKDYLVPGEGSDKAAATGAVAAPAPTQPVASSADWYYLSGGQQVGPVPEGDLRHWLAQGSVPPDTQVWSASLTGWLPASQVPAIAPPPKPAPVAPAPAAPAPPAARRAAAPAAFCTKCGTKLTPGAAFCVKCGTKVG